MKKVWERRSHAFPPHYTLVGNQDKQNFVELQVPYLKSLPIAKKTSAIGEIIFHSVS